MWKKNGRKSQPGSDLEIIRENLNNMPMEELNLLKEQLTAGDDMKIEKVTPKECKTTSVSSSGSTASSPRNTTKTPQGGCLFLGMTTALKALKQ